MEKMVCPQCGSNEIAVFGSAAYKCESCGTILKEEPRPPQPPPVQQSSPVQEQKPKPFRSKREFTVLNDEDGFTSTDDLSQYRPEPDPESQKVLFLVILIVAIVFGIWIIFS